MTTMTNLLSSKLGMITRTAAALAVCGAVAGGVMLSGGQKAMADDKKAAAATSAKAFDVDAVHSSVVFRIKHLNAAWFYGTFDKVSGSFSVGETLSADVVVDAGSVDTNNGKRDEHVKGPDFFSAKEFPEMKFSAKGFTKSGDNSYKGKGSLTFRGVTKEMDMTINLSGMGKNRGGQDVAGIDATFTFKRSDFGNNYMVGPLSDEVSVMVGIEGVAK